jgi:lysophospholipase L1-like esterase
MRPFEMLAGAIDDIQNSARQSLLCFSSMKGTGTYAWLLALVSSSTFAHDPHQPGGSASLPTASHSVRIVTFGDSTTATARDWAPEIKGVYSDCLPGALAPQGIGTVVINAGIGDTTTRQAVARLDRDVRRHHPDVVVVQFGINDSWIDVDEGRTKPRLTRVEFRRNLTLIARRLKQDGARVILMTPNPMRWRDAFYIKAFAEHPGLLDVQAVRGIDLLLDLYAEDVRNVAKNESLPLVDVFDAFERYGNIPGQAIDDILLAGDGIHPNQAGQRLVCRLLAAQIVELLTPSAVE